MRSPKGLNGMSMGGRKVSSTLSRWGGPAAVVVSAHPFHDLGFLVVGLGWILLGIPLRRQPDCYRGHTRSVRADLGVPG